MLLAVREIMDAENPLPIRIGVNQGSVFVGEVGPALPAHVHRHGRRGQPGRPPDGEGGAGRDPHHPGPPGACRGPASTSTELEPFLVKGKAKPVRAVRLGAKTRGTAAGADDELPFVGRAARARSSSRRSRNRPWRARRAGGDRRRDRGRKVAAGRPPARDHHRPHAALRRLRALRLLDPVLHRAADPPGPPGASGRGQRRGPGQRSFLSELERRAPELVPWAPLIGMAIAVPVPETRETLELEEEFRRTKLAEVTIALLAVLLPQVGPDHRRRRALHGRGVGRSLRPCGPRRAPHVVDLVPDPARRRPRASSPPTTPRRPASSSSR